MSTGSDDSAAAPPLFIVGCDRSGTTLLRLMLDQSRDLHIPEESRFLTALDDRLRDYGDFSEPRQRWFFIRDLQMNKSTDTSYTFPIFGLTPQEAEAALRAAAPTGLFGAAEALFAQSARKKGKRRWGDKTPCHVMDIPRLAAGFPRAQFVHLIRDGRDVADSLARAGWVTDVREAARLWKSRVEAGRAAGAALGPRRYRELRFEALVTRPEQLLKELCAWLGVDYEEAMLRYYETAESRIVPEHARFHELLRRPPDASRALAWPRALGQWQVVCFEEESGGLLAALDYPPAGSRVLKAARGVVKTLRPVVERAAGYLRRATKPA